MVNKQTNKQKMLFSFCKCQIRETQHRSIWFWNKDKRYVVYDYYIPLKQLLACYWVVRGTEHLTIGPKCHEFITTHHDLGAARYTKS